MSAFFYYLLLPFIYLLSAVPFGLLYIKSDFFYFLIYRVFGYRKKVVIGNLRNAFPEKSEAELQLICKKFYRHLCDLFLETFKTLTISKKAMLRHCKFNPEAKALFDQLAADKQNIILAMGHQGNWEWAGNTFSLECKQQLYVIYHPLTNKKFNGLIYKMRTRFSTKLIAMRDTYKDMVANKNELNATAFIADQTPQPNNAYWTTFLNQDTPVFLGTEKIAKKLNYPVVYAQVKKIKRGYYEIFAEMLVAEPKNTAEGEISERYTRRLEKDIIAQPETWLWSHRRWKHKRITNQTQAQVAQ
ncbi:lysophospholipid acyltransferase family protein [Taibaiella soli]|uniref:Lipid A biosynthesis acyltransferase n=1 Tax=Taibaiella soli TaxID=1649169 RepID=A0A2W2AVP5_9BACT|nr:lysophospholipid acyltransferase family protein [Taibaiella soli]PZF71748.1 lipid A biosynthesis acyltransferase [Taibaiella soli]